MHPGRTCEGLARGPLVPLQWRKEGCIAPPSLNWAPGRSGAQGETGYHRIPPSRRLAGRNRELQAALEQYLWPRASRRNKHTA